MISLSRRPAQQYDQMMPAAAAMADVTSYQRLIADSLDSELPSAAAPLSGGALSGADSPALERVYQNSWKGMLARNLGRQVIISFLVGTQETVVAHGLLYEVGNDYVALYQPERRSYITADFYSIKFVEFVPEREGAEPIAVQSEDATG